MIVSLEKGELAWECREKQEKSFAVQLDIRNQTEKKVTGLIHITHSSRHHIQYRKSLIHNMHFQVQYDSLAMILAMARQQVALQL